MLNQLANKQELNNKWDIEFLEGGPVIPAKQSGLSLHSWTSISGSEDVNNFSGIAKYSSIFTSQQAMQNRGYWTLVK